jgi:hypothetical protein
VGKLELVVEEEVHGRYVQLRIAELLEKEGRAAAR